MLSILNGFLICDFHKKGSARLRVGGLRMLSALGYFVCYLNALHTGLG